MDQSEFSKYLKMDQIEFSDEPKKWIKIISLAFSVSACQSGSKTAKYGAAVKTQNGQSNN